MATNEVSHIRRQNLLPNEIPDNKENIQLIWLDANMDGSDDHLLTQTMLTELNPAVQFYSDIDRSLDLIKSIKDEQILLIVSGAFARRLLSQTHQQRTLVAIFIFCSNRQHHQPLMQEYNKIIGIFTDQKSLLEAIREKMDLVEKQTLAFSLFDQKQKSSKDLSKESASFLVHQMLIYVLRQMPQDERSKKEMLDMCHDYYTNNKRELAKIEEFKRSYNRAKAIEWYTDECFLYKLLNKALRTEDLHLLYTFRFFIIDLCSALENEHSHFKDKKRLTVYRGTHIPSEEVEKLSENVGKIISTNGFLSTTHNINISLTFIHSSGACGDLQPVLFEIDADPSLRTAIFADVEDKTRVKGEEEVLFSLNSLFKIHSVHFDSTLNVWKVQLKTTDEGAEKVDEYLALSRQQMQECSPIIYFGRLLLYELGQVERAGKYFDMLLKSIPSDHPAVAAVYNHIGLVHDKRNELNLALKNYEIAYDLRRQQLPSNHPHIAASLHNIGNAHRGKGDFDAALDYYQKALQIDEINYPGDHLGKAMTIENIGRVYNDKKDFDTALTYLSRALEMFKHVLPTHHSQIAGCFGAIGSAHEKKGDLDTALNCYHQQLNMGEQCLPFDHPDLSVHLGWIIDTYRQMHQIDKALECCQEKLIVQKTRLGENHPRVARTLMIMADLIEDIDPNKSLQYYGEALSILENFTLPDDKTTSGCLSSMACLYGNYDMTEDALRCELKALDINRRLFSADHVDIATSLNNIGISYQELNNFSEAHRYFAESLSIYQSNYGSNHEKVKRVEGNIARLTDKPLSSSSRHEE